MEFGLWAQCDSEGIMDDVGASFRNLKIFIHYSRCDTFETRRSRAEFDQNCRKCHKSCDRLIRTASWGSRPIQTRRKEKKKCSKETQPSGFDAMPINFYSFIEHSGIMKASTAVNTVIAIIHSSRNMKSWFTWGSDQESTESHPQSCDVRETWVGCDSRWRSKVGIKCENVVFKLKLYQQSKHTTKWIVARTEWYSCMQVKVSEEGARRSSQQVQPFARIDDKSEWGE